LEELIIDYDSRFNFKQIDKLAKIDHEIFRDKMYKEIMPDAMNILKKLKIEAK